MPSRLSLALSLALPLASSLAQAAPDPKDVAQVRERMEGIAPRMTGTWKGGGWVASRDGRVQFTSEETIRSVSDGAALLVEGRHRNAKGEIHFQATGLIAWDVPRGEYRMLSALADGKTGTFPLREQADGRYVWTIVPDRGPTVRYTITLEPAGHWNEVGELSADGATWTKFFEMDLDRVAAGPRPSR